LKSWRTRDHGSQIFVQQDVFLYSEVNKGHSFLTDIKIELFLNELKLCVTCVC